ncbi:MAG: twin-arginine translocation signal domain-containing protein [Deltaproteobacteria bacterium]|nr:twin-arginine translocation signal domain-containing protein [Deltaproteobacteria bacterium]
MTEKDGGGTEVSRRDFLSNAAMTVGLGITSSLELSHGLV